jgi:hypothetical protein
MSVLYSWIGDYVDREGIIRGPHQVTCLAPTCIFDEKVLESELCLYRVYLSKYITYEPGIEDFVMEDPACSSRRQ